MTNGDLATELLAALAGSRWCGPRCRRAPRSARLGAARCVRCWPVWMGHYARPGTFEHVNTARSTLFAPRTTPQERSRAWWGWQGVVGLAGRGGALARVDRDGGVS
jgi:hypothetical protein